MRIQTARLALLLIGVLCLDLGCGVTGGTSSIATVPVKGKVTYKGKPLSQGSIKFQPVDDGMPAHGQIQSDGSFELTTVKPGDGAVAGRHLVSITGTKPGPGQSPASPRSKELIPKKYNSPNSTDLETEVSAEKTDYTLDLK